MSPPNESDLRCERVRLLLSLSLDGATTPAQDAEIAEHLPSCAGCRAAQRSDMAVRARCAEPATVPMGFTERVAAAAGRQRLEARAQNRFLLTAAVAAVLVAGVALVSHSRGEAPADRTLRAAAPRDDAGRALRAVLALDRTPLDREDR